MLFLGPKWASLVAHQVKNLPAMQETGDVGSIPGSGRSPGGRRGNPLQSQGQRSLASYSPQGRKESDMTECLDRHES